MVHDESYERIRRALDRLLEEVPEAVVAPPPPASKVVQLIDEAGPLAPGLEAYFACCNGVSDRDPQQPFSTASTLFSIERMLDIDTPGFFAIEEDGPLHYTLL